MATALKNALGKCCVDWIATNGQRHRRTVPCDCARVKRGKPCAVAKTEAKLMTREIQAQKKERGTVHVADTAQVIDAWLTTKTLLAEASIARYQTTARHWKRVLIVELGVARFYALTKRNIEQYRDIRLREGAHRKTLRCELVALWQLCGWAVESEQGYHDENVMVGVERPTVPPRLPTPWQPLERDALLEAARPDARRYLMLCLGIYCSLRRSGVASLRVDKVQLNERRPFLTVIEKGDKERMSWLAPEVVEAFRRYPPEHAVYWFGPPTKRALDNISNEMCGFIRRVTGLSGQRARFHCARHTAITDWLKDGAKLEVVAKAAGHASIRTTMQYRGVADEEVREMMIRPHFRVKDSMVTEDLATAVAKLPALPS